jgi:hypothetical protein
MSVNTFRLIKKQFLTTSTSLQPWYAGQWRQLLRLKYHGISVYTSDHLATNLKACSLYE